jgi:predicted MPP superfamily phosphohydrolase
MTRREFLKIARNTAVGSALASGLTTAGYAALFEPNRLKISRTQVQMKRLPRRFDGLRIVLMADFHLFPFTSAELIKQAIHQANALNADLALFAGDFVYSEAEAATELSPILAQLNPKLGSFAALGQSRSDSIDWAGLSLFGRSRFDGWRCPGRACSIY